MSTETYVYIDILSPSLTGSIGFDYIITPPSRFTSVLEKEKH
mgnify:CR=1|jgi:hypothetical protein